MKKLLSLLLCVPLIFTTCKKEEDELNINGINCNNNTFDLTYSVGANLSVGSSISQTLDEGYIITGISTNVNGTDNNIFLLKIDCDGIEEWTKTFGGIQNDIARVVNQTADGGFVVCGSTNSFGSGGEDVWVIKTDGNGNEQWNRTFGGTADDVGYSIQQTNDGGYIVIGTTQSFGNGNGDIFLIKIDANGVEQWTKTFGDIDYNDGYSVQQTTDGGYILLGDFQTIEAPVYRNVWMIKTDNNGNQQWSKTFGGSGADNGYSIEKTADGGYIVVGRISSESSGSSDGEMEIWLIKTDANGNQQWDNTYGDGGASGGLVQQTNDGGYIIFGGTNLSGGAGDMTLMIKTDAYGNIQWTKTFGSGNDGHLFYGMDHTFDGGYIITGSDWNAFGTGINTWVIKTDDFGNL